MELRLATFEQAKTLKELGFPQGGLRNAYYGPNGECVPVNVCSPIDWKLDAPTLELAAKWLREEKGLIVEVNYTYDDTYHWDVIQRKQPSKMKQYGVIPLTDNRTYQNTYEEALSVGIDKAIEVLKEKE